MKNNNGITLTSLIIYIIGMTIMVATIATLTSFFYKNIDIGSVNTDTIQYTKFSSIFLEEIDRQDNSVIDCKELTNGISYIVFSSGNQYTFNEESKSIYKNNIKICNNIEKCDFSYTFIDSKYNVKVNFKSGSINMTGDNAITYSF